MHYIFKGFNVKVEEDDDEKRRKKNVIVQLVFKDTNIATTTTTSITTTHFKPKYLHAVRSQEKLGKEKVRTIINSVP